MSHYQAPLGDMSFQLFDVWQVQQFWQQQTELAELIDADTAAAILEEAAKITAEKIAPLAAAADEQGVSRVALEDADLSVLLHERELDLLRALSEYPGVLATSAELRAPHRVATWVRDFASRVHGFYRDCRVITNDAALTQARLWLAEASRIGLADALGILGVGAPAVMERLDEDEDETEGALGEGQNQGGIG